MGSALDEMVQIHEAGKGNSQSPPFLNVRRIVYTRLDELPALLNPAAKSTLRVDAAPFVPLHVQKAMADVDNRVWKDYFDYVKKEHASLLKSAEEELRSGER